MTPREIVRRTLEFDSPERVPRHLWLLDWALIHHGEEVDSLRRAFPDDIVTAPGFHRQPPKTQGSQTAVGRYVDEWGCIFDNVQAGVIGEVKEPIVTDEEWADVSRVRVPRGWLTVEVERVNEWCASQDRFVLAAACPRPFEQLQFIRGTEGLYVDLALESAGLRTFIESMHTFYCDLLDLWSQTDVDGLQFMDDWGAQSALLIDPEQWRRIFKPLYRDYVEIAHRAGKKAFMHSDGHILAIYPDLVEIGVDAINSQLFCMGIDEVSRHAGEITFWGEIDRQHLLPFGTPEEIDEAVREVRRKLWRGGGCIAQCEFGAGSRPQNVRQVFATWAALAP